MVATSFGQLISMSAMSPELSGVPFPVMSVSLVTSIMVDEEFPSHTLTIWVFSVPELPIVTIVLPSLPSKRTFSW